MNPLIKKERNQSTFSSDDSDSRTKFFGLTRHIRRFTSGLTLMFFSLASVIVNSLINIEHTFRSIIFDFYQRPIYMVEYMVNPVESTIERIGNRVHIIQTGAGGAETARAITDQPVTLVGETEAAAGAGAPIEPSKVVVVVIIGIYFI